MEILKDMPHWLRVIIITIVVVGVVELLAYGLSRLKRRQLNTSTAEVGRFNNPITRTFLWLVILLLCWGWVAIYNLTLFSIILGIASVSLGTLIWKYGEIRHSPTNPKENGVVTFGGKILTLPGTRWSESIVVSGNVILAPYWPLELSTVKVDVESKSENFPFEITTRDGATFSSKVAVIGEPDKEDLPDFIQAGNSMGAVFLLMDTVIESNTRALCRSADFKDIVSGHARITELLTEKIEEHLATKDFGIKIKKVQFIPILDQNLKDLLAGKLTEKLQREKEKADHATMIEMARELQLEFAAGFSPVPLDTLSDVEKAALVKQLVEQDEIPTLALCLRTMQRERLIREGKATEHTLDIIGGPDRQLIINGGQPQR